MITVTETAADKIKDILAEENNPGAKLRMFVQGGGCSGFSYGFTIDDKLAEDDWAIEANGVHVLVDSMSAQYLEGAIVDYKEELIKDIDLLENNSRIEFIGDSGLNEAFEEKKDFDREEVIFESENKVNEEK